MKEMAERPEVCLISLVGNGGCDRLLGSPRFVQGALKSVGRHFGGFFIGTGTPPLDASRDVVSFPSATTDPACQHGVTASIVMPGTFLSLMTWPAKGEIRLIAQSLMLFPFESVTHTMVLAFGLTDVLTQDLNDGRSLS